MLRLDPIDDREEFAALAELLSENMPLREALEKSDLPEADRLSLRIRNLGIDRFTVWAPGEAGSVLERRPQPGHPLPRRGSGIAVNTRRTYKHC